MRQKSTTISGVIQEQTGWCRLTSTGPTGLLTVILHILRLTDTVYLFANNYITQGGLTT